MTRPRRLLLGAILIVAGGITGLLPQVARGDPIPTIAVVPPSSVVPITQGTVQVRIAVQNVADMGAWEFGLEVSNPDVLEIPLDPNKPDPAPAPGTVTPLYEFFNLPGATCQGPQFRRVGDVVMQNAIYFGCNAPGVYNRERGQYEPGVSGSGDLAVVTLNIKGTGDAPLTFYKVGLAHPEGDEIPADGANGVVTVLAPAEPTPTALPPTPTKVPGALTPTPPPDAPTPDPTQAAEATAVATATAGAGGGQQNTGGTPSGSGSGQGGSPSAASGGAGTAAGAGQARAQASQTGVAGTAGAAAPAGAGVAGTRGGEGAGAAQPGSSEGQQTGAARGTSGPSGSARGSASGRSGNANFPGAGTGPGDTSETWSEVLGGVLAAVGAALVLSALSRSVRGLGPDQG